MYGFSIPWEGKTKDITAPCEELVPTSVIEQHGYDLADLGARASRDGKA